ncbi:hypothetical protein BHAOGJBA_5148 [Methylobacterium hispanicum]|uniref:Uncharacterized protein n=1 Tax=Methylobacterium hispanicum TaxID=270350 RepID=A0AAV4ZUC5_9HYPH|nr:hypothetical protein [Methylobacterium hispanicum]GJD91600.1 hypothetical protein BHAOGJBA_5148 [Methylobacterium hispanicum]
MRVLTTCSALKSVRPPDDLLARTLARGSVGDVVAEWVGRLRDAEGEVEAAALYVGRGFGHAAAAAVGAPWIASAGLGLLAPRSYVPSYGATVAAGPEDDVFRRIDGPRDPGAWWAGLANSPFACPVDELFQGEGPVLAALSAPYLAMLADDLAALPPGDLSRLRIFTASAPGSFDARLRPYAMPRNRAGLDDVGGYRGVVADYAQRALRHFVETVLPAAPEADLDAHAAMMAGEIPVPALGPAPR